MDISIVLFLLGISHTPDSEFLKSEWKKLNEQQQIALINQFEREYTLDLENLDPSSIEQLRKLQLRAWDRM